MNRIQSAQICPAFSSCSITGPSTVVLGTNVTYTVNWNGGTAPYGVGLNLDATSLVTRDGITGTSTSFTVPVNWSTGSYHIYANVFYQCSDGTFKDCITNGIAITTVPSPTCPALASCYMSGPKLIASGDIGTYSVSWSGGQSPYDVDVYIDNTYYKSTIGITGTSTSVYFDTSGWTGDHIIRCYIYYQCSDGTTQACWTNILNTGITGAGYNCAYGACTPAAAGVIGLYPDYASYIAACSPPPGVGYNCISPGNCQPAPSGTTGTYPDIQSCNIGCPIVIGGKCDPTTCPPDKNFCISGTCVPKTYITYGVIGFGAIFLLNMLK